MRPAPPLMINPRTTPVARTHSTPTALDNWMIPLSAKKLRAMQQAAKIRAATTPSTPSWMIPLLAMRRMAGGMTPEMTRRPNLPSMARTRILTEARRMVLSTTLGMTTTLAVLSTTTLIRSAGTTRMPSPMTTRMRLTGRMAGALAQATISIRLVEATVTRAPLARTTTRAALAALAMMTTRADLAGSTGETLVGSKEKTPVDSAVAAA